MRYLYALEHIPTGRMLPRPPSGRRGGTYAEPIDPGQHLPRLFHRERDAKGFLTVWLRGPLRPCFEADWESGVEEYVGNDHEPNLAKEPRIANDWRVVKIEWRIVS